MIKNLKAKIGAFFITLSLFVFLIPVFMDYSLFFLPFFIVFYIFLIKLKNRQVLFLSISYILAILMLIFLHRDHLAVVYIIMLSWIIHLPCFIIGNFLYH